MVTDSYVLGGHCVDRGLYTEFVQELIIDTHSEEAVDEGDPLGQLVHSMYTACTQHSPRREHTPTLWAHH